MSRPISRILSNRSAPLSGTPRGEHPSRPTVASWFQQLPSGSGEQP